jgi:2-methylcitrate dehydratase PrpD
MSVTVSERLTAFLGEWSSRGAPAEAMHEAKRLILNQLKASVAATTNPAVTILHDWARAETRPNGGAHALWFGSELSPAHAAVVNGALFEVLDFHDTYIPTFMHAVSAVLPAVLALAEAEGPSGARVLNALALGLEVELAIATILMPTAYYRGYVPAGLVGGVGAAAACSVLAGLDEAATRNALGLAMCTAFGLYESVGSMGLAYVTGATARSGLTAFELARRGLDAPPTAFEGDKGMLVTHSDEDAAKIETVLASLGGEWRIHGQSYKTVPTETITHPVVECVLALVARARGRTLDRMTFAVQPIVVTIADERRDRFGAPSSELMARFDLRFCAAAAWVRGVFTLAEMRKAAYTDPDILALRDRIELVPDEARASFDGCALDAVFTDGSTERIVVDAFLGSPGRRMTDDQLSALFRASADGLLAPDRIDGILDAVWGLDRAGSVGPLIDLLKLS